MANQYDESPYVTLRHELLLRDPNLTVADKFVDDKELEVSDCLSSTNFCATVRFGSRINRS